MCKAIYKGLVPSDEPMFSVGQQRFSRSELNRSFKTSASDTTWVTQDLPVQASERTFPYEALTPLSWCC